MTCTDCRAEPLELLLKSGEVVIDLGCQWMCTCRCHEPEDPDYWEDVGR